MEKMDLIQTCLNDRLLEANLACRTYACLFCSVSTCDAVGFCGCAAPGMLSLQQQSHLGETHGQNPAGGQHTVTPPKKSRQQKRAEEKLQIHKGPLRGSSLSWVCKAFTKPPAIISLVLAAQGVRSHAFWRARRPPSSSSAALTRELRNETAERQPVHQADREANTWHKKIKSGYWNCCKITNLRA